MTEDENMHAKRWNPFTRLRDRALQNNHGRQSHHILHIPWTWLPGARA